LVEAAVHVDPFKGWVQGQAFQYVALNEFSLYRPLFRRFCILNPFAKRIDEDETGYVPPDRCSRKA
jgi:hypothetical protein